MSQARGPRHDVQGPDDADREAAPRAAPLVMTGEEFRRAGHALVDRIATFLEGLPDRPVTTGEGPESIRAVLGADRPLPEDGADADGLLAEAADLLMDHGLFNGHPRFFGYITASPAPIGMLGDLLASAVNANCGGWVLSPMASEIEAQTVRWIADLIGFGEGGDGLLVSGGNMANMTAILAARTRMADWDVRERGLFAEGSRPLRVYGSAETHTWIQKAADMFGLGGEAMRWIPTGDDLRMDLRALRDAIDRDLAEGALPMMVVGTAGSVSTGAVDDLPAIAEVCRDRGVWFHVDGAYGGFAAAVPDLDPRLAGIGEADSIAIDPHKWLYAPVEAGCTLVRDPAALRDAFAYHPAYYYFGVEATNYLDLGPQNSRGFKALKVWLALRQVGRRGYQAMIAEDCALSRRLHRNVQEHPELEAFTQDLSINTFRYVPPELWDRRADPEVATYLNELNEKIMGRLERGGEAFVSIALIRGTFLLRACIVNFNTGPADVDALPEIVARAGRAVAGEAAAPSG
ncbi:MAG TPA: aspartate aminotransferase family protein [Longimicrobiales bacterium]|nr:aspartate aminotransferase family protein [Longimicrobiales bacterium]